MGAPETIEVPADEFSVIAPIESDVQFNGKPVKIVPLKVGQLPKFARALKGIAVAHLDALAKGDYGVLFDLIGDHGEDIIVALAVATGLPESELKDSEVDEAVSLAVSVMKVNADFFARRLMPAVKKAMDQANGVGRTASNP